MHISTEFVPPKLWSYDRDGVISPPVNQRPILVCIAAPNVLSQVVVSVVQLELRFTLISAQVLVVLQSMTWPILRISHLHTGRVQAWSYLN